MGEKYKQEGNTLISNGINKEIDVDCGAYPSSKLDISGVPFRYYTVSVGFLEGFQTIKHAVPLLIIVALHFVFDLPLKAYAFQTTQSLFCQPWIDLA